MSHSRVYPNKVLLWRGIQIYQEARKMETSQSHSERSTKLHQQLAEQYKSDTLWVYLGLVKGLQLIPAFPFPHFLRSISQAPPNKLASLTTISIYLFWPRWGRVKSGKGYYKSWASLWVSSYQYFGKSAEATSNNVRKRKRRKGSWKGRRQAPQEDLARQHPGYYQACHPSSCPPWWSQAHLWSHL